MTIHLLSCEAYERKAELGGGWRGQVIDRRLLPSSDALTRSDIFPSKAAAILWCRQHVANVMQDTPWAPGYIYRPNWYMNVFVN